MKKYTIPQPCHENWNQMESEEKGKFCAVCQTKVYDFTTATSSEIETAFLREKGNICGKIIENKIPQPTSYQKSAWNFKIFNGNHFARFSIAASAASLLLTFSGCSQKIKNADNSDYRDVDSTATAVDSIAVSDSSESYQIMGKMAPPQNVSDQTDRYDQNNNIIKGKMMQLPPKKESSEVPKPVKNADLPPPTKEQLKGNPGMQSEK